jgi:hypothetical protein
MALHRFGGQLSVANETWFQLMPDRLGLAVLPVFNGLCWFH